MLTPPVRVLGLCGSLSSGTTEAALREALLAAGRSGAEVDLLDGAALDLPAYSPGRPRTRGSARLTDAVRAADALLVASPAYHGSVSGLMKNALDHLQELAEDDPPYLDGKAVGCVGVADGWQGAVNVLRVLRDVTHALRGWPVPMGVALNSRHDWSGDGWALPRAEQLAIVGRQVVEFAVMRRMSERHLCDSRFHAGRTAL